MVMNGEGGRGVRRFDERSTEKKGLREKNIKTASNFSQILRLGNSPGQDQGDVVRLLGGADPVLHRRYGMFADAFQRQVTGRKRRFHQAIFAEFAKLILRLRHAVAEGDEDVARVEVHPLLL